MLVLYVVVLAAACQFQPRGSEVDASGVGDDAATDEDATNNDPDASAIDATMAIDARIDAVSGATDAAQCPAACTSCRVDGTCVIDCGPAQCMSGVTCPAGRPCVVNCIGNLACEQGVINCLQATSCDITCQGTDACDAGINCAGDSCTVVCSGSAACEDGGVDCTANTCNITCSGAAACANHVCCSGSNCGGGGGGTSCTSSSGGCCSCSGC